jgi:hypothetical protein
MAVVQVVLGVVLLVLAASMSAAGQVLWTRANPGVRLPFWGKPSDPLTPTAARVFSGLAVASAVFGLAALDASFWWGAVVVLAVGALPYLLIRVFVHLHPRLRSGR